MKREEISSFINNAILILLTVQIAFVSISIAVSSIAFGIWLGLWLIQILAGKKFDYPKEIFAEIKVVNYFILLYIFFEIFSRFFAVFPDGAFTNLKRLLLFLIFFVSIIKVTGFETLCRILFVLICAASLTSVYELVLYGIKFSELIRQMPFSEIRIDYLSYPLTAGEIKMLILLSVLPIIFSKEKFLNEWKYLPVILLPVFISMLLTQSRNVFLAVFICFLIYGIFVNRKFLMIFIAVLIISGIFLPAEYTSRITSIADLSHTSNSSRLTMWKTGLQIFADHPFTGVADSHIKEIYETYKKPEVYGEGVHLHNNFIMILATTGIFGFISYLGIFITLFLKQIKFYKSEKNITRRLLIFGSILVMISFHISGIFEWSFGDHEVMTVFFFLISIPVVIRKLSSDFKR